MPITPITQSLYVRQEDAGTWEAARRVAKTRGVSFSLVVPALLRDWLKDQNEWPPTQSSAGTSPVCIECDLRLYWTGSHWEHLEEPEQPHDVDRSFVYWQQA
jgi:hypothetical protein